MPNLQEGKNEILNVAVAVLQSFLSFSWLNNMKIVQFVKGVWWYRC